MHWLLSLDTALFHLVNGTMANPFFDWLMPKLSGNGVPWLLALIVAMPLVSAVWGGAVATLRRAHGPGGGLG